MPMGWLLAQFSCQTDDEWVRRPWTSSMDMSNVNLIDNQCLEEKEEEEEEEDKRK